MRNRGRIRSAVGTACILVCLVLFGSSPALAFMQTYSVSIDVDAGTADREDKPVDLNVDLTEFLSVIPGTLDPATLQVIEVDGVGASLNESVLFQFAPNAAFDPTTNAAGNLVFVMDGTTAAGATRHYRLAFDLVGDCPTCPAPPAVTVPVTVDSLTYQNQDTYLVTTPGATYYYHKLGAGLASMIDPDTNDWINFQDVGGSGSAGEYRGIPNLVFDSGDASSSYFHPGFTNATTQLVQAGPLKVTLLSTAGPAGSEWDVQWDFYPEYARMTVLSAGADDSDPYWFLYEGTVGGSMDAGDVVVRSGGIQTSAFDYAQAWEGNLPSPKWAYFRDTSASRALFLSDDQGSGTPDSYRPMGQSAASAPEMTVFGFGRVLDTSANALTGRLYGTGRSFTVGFAEDHTVAEDVILASSEPLVVQTDIPGPELVVVVSDDFSALAFDDILWTFVDPVGDATMIQDQGRLRLSVPAGQSHDLWTGGNNSAHVLQDVLDADMDIEIKFESIPSSQYQMQGLILEDSPGNYIRTDFYHDGIGLHLFAASFLADSPTSEGDIMVSPAGSDIWLRVIRTGDNFDVQWSDDGSTWNTGFSFDHTLIVRKAGVFAGNAGSALPAYEAVVDYFFDHANPIVPEDGGGADVWPPTITDITVLPDPLSGTALVSCTTLEPAGTVLSFGLDTNYGTDVVGTSADSLDHSFTLTGLLPDQTYHFAIEATDELANAGTTPDQSFFNEETDPLIIDVWGGLSQRVGHLGDGQTDFNLLGHVQNYDLMDSLFYSLNGADEEPLNWGLDPNDFGDGRRLAHNGDFNVDLPVTNYLMGANSLAIRAVDMLGREFQETVSVTRGTGSISLPQTIDWSTVTDVQDIGQRVDGNWTADASGLSIERTGYDRLFLIGENSWQDYEITCSVTVNDIHYPTGPMSGSPGVGLLLRFAGHIEGGYRNWPEAQPKWGYHPFGTIGWLRYYTASTPTVQWYHGDYDVADNYGGAKAASNSFELDVPPETTLFGERAMVTNYGEMPQVAAGETFQMKMRCETLADAPDGDGRTRYSYKVWLSTDPEPTEWSFSEIQESQHALRQGSLCLLAHHVDATFGDVTVVDLSTPTAPFAADDDLAAVTGSSADADVLANDTDADGLLDPATVTITGAPLNGSISGIDPATGIVTYLHDGGVAVADSFTYTVDDDEGQTSNTAMVRVTISAPVPPVAVDDELAVGIGSTTDLDVLANDSDADGALDPSTVLVTGGPFNGTITGVDAQTGVVTYQHDGGVAVADSFTYTVEDNDGEISNTATVRLTIEPLIGPTAADDTAVVGIGATGDVFVLTNDTPGNGVIDPATVVVTGAPLNGTILGIDTGTGAVTYQHDGGVAEADSFTYTVDDVNGATSNTAMVHVAISEIPAGDFVSDDFNTCTLDPAVWTFVDPQGDANPPVIQGAYSGDAKLALTVPNGGTSHELFGGVIGAPYVIQPTSNTDFTVEVKFDSALPATSFAEQGIIIRQDDMSWLRMEFYSNSSDQISILAGVANNINFPTNEVITGLPAGTTPLYMRVQRLGDDWTQSWSSDGTIWTAMPSFNHPLTVTGVGVYAGNAGANPEHTILVDYFSNSLAPIVEPDDTGQNTLTLNAIGDGAATPSPDQASYACGDPVQLTAAPDPGWIFDSWSGDLTGNTNPIMINMDGPRDITATFLPSGPPVAPVAVDDADSVITGYLAAVDVLANDTDVNADIDPSTVAVLAGPLNGTITGIDPVTGVVNYQHDGGVALADSFTYTVEDEGGLLSNVATVRVTIVPPIPPVAGDDQLVVTAGASGVVDVLANDSDSDGVLVPGTVSVATGPFHGTVTDIDPVTGAITYLHDGGLAEADSFTYTVEDDHGTLSNAAMVRVTIGQSPTGDFVSDDFNACSLDPAVWAFVNPQSDAPDPFIQGAFSGDAQLAITVPSGTSHELYDGIINAPHVIQSTSDGDFTLEVKFDSVMPPVNYAEQGIVVRQDDNEWLRFEFYTLASDQVGVLMGRPDNVLPNNTTIAGATAGTSPLYMRVQRVGDDWIQSYSTDGVNWTALPARTYALNVTGVGVHAGNAGSNPEHTVLVDYFSNSLAPIVEPDDTGQNTLTVNIVGNGAVTASPDQAVYACGDPVQLTPVPDPGWAFDGWSGDLTGNADPANVTMDRALTITATFVPVSGNTLAASTDGLPAISTATPRVDGVPVIITRDNTLDLRGYTVTVGLTDLDLIDGTASIQEADYLSSVGTTDFQVTDNLDGTWEVVADITGGACGATAMNDTLFTLDLTNLVPDGTGSIALLAVELRDCAGSPLPATTGPAASITIDTTAPAGVTNLAASQVLTGNPAGEVTGIDVTWTASADPDVTEVRVYRRGFGFYPEYDDNGGAAPALPADPLAEGWTLVAAVAPGTVAVVDQMSTRDYWYFCAQGVDAAGNASTAVRAGGVLNYLLGDASDGGVPILGGNNLVWTEDLTLLGSHYGTVEGQPLYNEDMDIGPTDDMSVNGRPTTDNVIDFEDLILLGINYGKDASGQMTLVTPEDVPAPASLNALMLDIPQLPGVGQTFQAELVMYGAGTIQGLNVPLAWDPAVVEPLTVQSGPLLDSQGGSSMVLAPEPGTVDLCLAGVRNSGISGTGTVATVTFKVLAAGLSGIGLMDVEARDSDNGTVAVTTSGISGVDENSLVPTVSALHGNYPNPFNPMTTIAFDLASAGRVRVAVYGIDGRRVRSLIDERMAVGRHEVVWDGRDQAGRTVASGTYLYMMEGPGIRETRRMLLVK